MIATITAAYCYRHYTAFIYKAYNELRCHYYLPTGTAQTQLLLWDSQATVS
jgi:hypothetical protein